MFGAFLLFEDDFIHIVSIAFTALILTELLMVALTVRTWHYLMIVGELLSLLLYVASLFIFHSYFGQCQLPQLPVVSWCSNPLMGTGNYSATSNNMKLVHWLLMGGLLHLVQRGGAWAGCGTAQFLLAVPNVTAHPSMAIGQCSNHRIAV